MLHLVGYILEYAYDARPIKVKSPNNTSKWQMRFNSAFKGLKFVKIAFYALTVDKLFSYTVVFY
jgi:hypothetical protein